MDSSFFCKYQRNDLDISLATGRDFEINVQNGRIRLLMC